MNIKDKKIILSDRQLSYSPDNDFFCISVGDIVWDKPLYKQYGLAVEQQSSVTVEFVLQKHKLLRRIIKELDLLLAVGRQIRFVLFNNTSHAKSCRSNAQIKYEISIATNGRYKLEQTTLNGDVVEFIYIKSAPVLLVTDSINNWTFGIVSNGKNNDWVIGLIDSIRNQNIPNYEIIICGPSPFINKTTTSNVRILKDVILDDDIRAPISHKKNLIIKNSKYNNLCVMHDRFQLPKNWFQKFKDYGNYFDILCLKYLNEKNKRILVDWMKFCYPLTSLYRRNSAMPYDEWDENIIIPGGAFIVKKNLISGFMLDQRLYWNEMEDIQFSKMAYLNGLLISVDKNNSFISKEVRQCATPSSLFHLKIYGNYLWLKDILKIMVKYRISKFKYYLNLPRRI